jgi:predicted methyltransferase
MLHRNLLLIGVLGFGLSLSAAASAGATLPYVRSAVADPARAADARADARRHPAELATFAEVKPGDTVVDLIPGGGYFTRIFSKIVGPKGHVYAVWPNEYADEAADDVTATKAMTSQYKNVSVVVQPAAQFSIPTKADVIWTSQNYHDYPDKFMGKVDPVSFDKQVFASLKSGGVFVVVDHVAETGSGMRDTDTLHRIDPAIVKAQVTSVGFTFDGESDVLRNPADTHKTTVFDKSIRGHTDQFAYRFRKPR